jgi:hypothetical protein
MFVVDGVWASGRSNIGKDMPVFDIKLLSEVTDQPKTRRLCEMAGGLLRNR